MTDHPTARQNQPPLCANPEKPRKKEGKKTRESLFWPVVRLAQSFYGSSTGKRGPTLRFPDCAVVQPLHPDPEDGFFALQFQSGSSFAFLIVVVVVVVVFPPSLWHFQVSSAVSGPAISHGRPSGFRRGLVPPVDYRDVQVCRLLSCPEPRGYLP